MVLRRSTTLWTWLSAFRKAPRSTLIFIVFALGYPLLQASTSPDSRSRQRR